MPFSEKVNLLVPKSCSEISGVEHVRGVQIYTKTVKHYTGRQHSDIKLIY